MSRYSELINDPVVRSMVEPDARCSVCGELLNGLGGYWMGGHDIYCCSGLCAEKLLLVALDTVADTSDPNVGPDGRMLHWLSMAWRALERWTRATQQRRNR